MNDFNLDITNLVGVVRPKSFSLPQNASVKERSFKAESGPGCSPAVGTRRTIRGRWVSDNMTDSLSSYAFEYMLGADGKKIERTPEEETDVEPVMLAGEIRPTTVRRKK